MIFKKEVVVFVHGYDSNSKELYSLGIAFVRSFDMKFVDYNSYDDFYKICEDVYAQISSFSAGSKVHFVCHSMGGLIVKEMIKRYPSLDIGRIVMIGTPNNGSKLVEFLMKIPLVRRGIKKSATSLHPGSELFQYSIPESIEVGVIAGRRSFKINHYPSYFMRIISGGDVEHDGTVELDSTKIEGMKDFLVVDLNHSDLIVSEKISYESFHFIKKGYFLSNRKSLIKKASEWIRRKPKSDIYEE